MPTFGLTPAGFAVKPLANILSDMEAQVLGTIDPGYDLSPQTPDGQFLGIIANTAAGLWELAQAVYGSYNRSDSQGAALDAVGDITGTPREGASVTVVTATITTNSSAAGQTVAAGAFRAFVTGNVSLTFENAFQFVMPTGSGQTALVVMECTTPGPTPTINPGTLTGIVSPVTGIASVTNVGAQSVLGTDAELDAAYTIRQESEVANAGGSCNAQATAAAIIQLGASQSPPVSLGCYVLENTTAAQATIQGLVFDPGEYAVVIYDESGVDWAAGAGLPLIAQLLFDYRPAGQEIYTGSGATTYTFVDPVLGAQTVGYVPVTPVVLNVVASVLPLPAYSGSAAWTQLSASIKAALVAASNAPIPSNGIVPPGRFTPGGWVVVGAIESVIQSVAGVWEAESLTIQLGVGSPSAASLPVSSLNIAVLTSITINQATGTPS